MSITPAGIVLDGRVLDLHLQPLVGIERRQIVEMDLVALLLGVLEIDGVDLEQGEIALAVFRAADLAFDRVAGAQSEAADLRGRDVDVVGAGEIVGIGRAQEAEAVLQHLDHAGAGDLDVACAASCFRMANISSCLRMALAFSTATSSAKLNSSVGDLALRSCSFISLTMSCMGEVSGWRGAARPWGWD